MPDLTVAVCMYNAERYVEQTLACIVAQTRQDFDLLIMNDCSTDGSVSAVERFFAQNPHPHKLVSFERNGGICAARAFVEREVQTKYIIFVDADDCPYPTLVERLYDKITSDPDLMAVGCWLEYMDSAGRKLNGGIYLGETTKEGFYEKASQGKLIFMQPTAIYERSAALSVGGYQTEGFPDGKPRYRDFCEDLDLWTRMSDLYINGRAIVVIPEVLCRYRKHSSSLSANAVNMGLRMKQIKTNVKRRRAGLSDWTFMQFREQLSEREYRTVCRNAASAESLRRGYYLLRRGRIFSAAWQAARSIYYKPTYIFDKIRHNLIR